MMRTQSLLFKCATLESEEAKESTNCPHSHEDEDEPRDPIELSWHTISSLKFRISNGKKILTKKLF